MSKMMFEYRGHSAMQKETRKRKPKTYKGKSMKLGYGGRSAKLKDQLSKKGLPKKEIGGIIGKIARKKGAAPGGPNYHG